MKRNEYIDGLCREVCRHVLSGELSEADGREKVLSYMVQSRVHVQNAMRESALLQRNRGALEREKLVLLHERMTSGGPEGWSFEHGTVGSATHWARQATGSVRPKDLVQA